MVNRYLSITIFLLLNFSSIYGEPLKILYVAWTFPFPYQTFFVNQIKGLLEDGHDVSVLSLHNSPYSFPPELEAYNIEKITYNLNKLPPDRDFDIIYAALGAVGKVCIPLMDVKNFTGNLIVGIHTIPFPADISERVDLYLPCCNHFADELIELSADPNKVRIHKIGVDLSLWQFRGQLLPKDGTIKIVTVARLDKLKGIEYSIAAVSKLLATYNIDYQIVGDGKNRKQLQKIINRTNSGNSIKLVGYKSPYQVFEILSNANIFILPSITVNNLAEGTPSALKEAMAIGIPVITTPTGGIPELVFNGETGFLVPQKDVVSLSEAIAFAIENPDICAEMIVKGCQKVEQDYELQTQKEELNQILMENKKLVPAL